MEWATVYQILAPALVSAATWLCARASAWFKTRTDSELAHRMAEALNGAVIEAVRATAQQADQVIGRSRSVASAGGSRFTDGERRELKAAAMDSAKRNLGPGLVTKVRKALEIESDSALNAVLSTKIEATLDRLKKGVL